MLKKIYYSIKKKSLKKPIYLIHFITNKCNCTCGHCFYSKEINLKGKEDLSLKEIQSFSNQLSNIIWLSFSGGEPFLREDIDKIYEIYLKNNKPEIFNCPTNGILTKRIIEKTENMLNAGKIKNFSINLSLDGLEKTHNLIRGVKCFNNILETYDALNILKNKYPNLLIKVNTTISNINIKEIEDLNNFIKSRMPKIDFHSFDIIRGTPKDSNIKTPSIEELENIKPLLTKIWNSYEFFGDKSIQSKIARNTTNSLYDISLKILKTNKQPFPCYAGKIHCVLDNNGDVKLCELLPKVGNIRENIFKKVWNSENAIAQRKMIKRRGCTCTHLCFQNTNYMFNLKHWPRMLGITNGKNK